MMSEQSDGGWSLKGGSDCGSIGQSDGRLATSSITTPPGVEEVRLHTQTITPETIQIFYEDFEQKQLAFVCARS